MSLGVVDRGFDLLLQCSKLCDELEALVADAEKNYRHVMQETSKRGTCIGTKARRLIQSMRDELEAIERNVST